MLVTSAAGGIKTEDWLTHFRGDLLIPSLSYPVSELSDELFRLESESEISSFSDNSNIGWDREGINKYSLDLLLFNDRMEDTMDWELTLLLTCSEYVFLSMTHSILLPTPPQCSASAPAP